MGWCVRYKMVSVLTLSFKSLSSTVFLYMAAIWIQTQPKYDYGQHISTITFCHRKQPRMLMINGHTDPNAAKVVAWRGQERGLCPDHSLASIINTMTIFQNIMDEGYVVSSVYATLRKGVRISGTSPKGITRGFPLPYTPRNYPYCDFDWSQAEETRWT